MQFFGRIFSQFLRGTMLELRVLGVQIATAGEKESEKGKTTNFWEQQFQTCSSFPC